MEEHAEHSGEQSMHKLLGDPSGQYPLSQVVEQVEVDSYKK